MPTTTLRNLLLVLGSSLAFATRAEPSTGFKGIPWGTPCGDSVKSMESKGFVFSPNHRLDVHGDKSSPWQPQLFMADQKVRIVCSPQDADMELDTKQVNPYLKFEADSGDVTVALLCRGGKFVGARLEAELNKRSAVATLTEAAGAPVRTVRADGCTSEYWKCTADHSMLQPRGDAARYLERPVRSSPQFDPRDQPRLRYLILARTEDDAIRTAYRTCMNNHLARDLLESKRRLDGNRAAVE